MGTTEAWGTRTKGDELLPLWPRMDDFQTFIGLLWWIILLQIDAPTEDN